MSRRERPTMRAAHASLLVRHGFAEGTVLVEANAIRRRAKSEAKEQASGERSRAEEARECDVCHHRHQRVGPAGSRIFWRGVIGNLTVNFAATMEFSRGRAALVPWHAYYEFRGGDILILNRRHFPTQRSQR